VIKRSVSALGGKSARLHEYETNDYVDRLDAAHSFACGAANVKAAANPWRNRASPLVIAYDQHACLGEGVMSNRGRGGLALPLVDGQLHPQAKPDPRCAFGPNDRPELRDADLHLATE